MKHLLFFRYFCILVLGLISLSLPIFAELSISSSSQKQDYVPQGQTNVVMLSFVVTSTAEDINIDGITIQHSSETVIFGDGISKVKVYLDTNKDGGLTLTGDDPDVELVSETMTSTGVETRTLSFSSVVLISSANLTDTDEDPKNDRNSKGFLITYDFEGIRAEIGASANVILTEILGADPSNTLDVATVTNIATPTSNEVTITGVQVISVQDIAPEVVLPGQTKVPMLYVTVQLAEESILSNFDLNFTIYNEEENFVTKNGATTGIVQAELYEANFAPPFREELENDLPIKTVTETDFRDTSTFDFSFPEYPTDGSFTGITHGSAGQTSFYVLYDIGSDINVTASTVISAQLLEFSGIGNSSRLELSWPLDGQSRFSAATSLVAGMSLEEITSIIPIGDSFGPLNEIPMMSFTLRSNHANTTLNYITILNPGTVPFETVSNGTEDIVRVQVYMDSDADAEFSDTTDTLVGDVELGKTNLLTGLRNQKGSVVVALQTPGSPTVDGVLIEPYDEDALSYPDTNEKIFFVVYTVGTVFNGGTDGGVVTFEAEAQLGAIFASANIEVGGEVTSSALSLSGVSNSKPAIPSPTAIVSLSEESISIVSVKNISPQSVFLGQEKVPMLQVELQTNGTVTSASFEIRNPGGSFQTDGRGVKKIWVYRDNSPLGTFSDTDEFVSAENTYTSSTIAQVSNVTFENTSETFLILYDMGQNNSGNLNNPLSTAFIKAQLNDITGIGASGSAFGLVGQVPLPVIPASVTVNQTLIDDITLTAFGSVTDLTSTLDLTIEFSNDSGSDIDIEDITPKVYLNDISGDDISYEFNLELVDDYVFPVTIPNGQTASFDFDVRHVSRISDGSGILDATLHYTVPGVIDPESSSVLVSRRRTGASSWRSAALETITLALFSDYDDYVWIFPPHVASVQFIRNTVSSNFPQGGALSVGDKLTVQFQNNGAGIDQSDIEVRLNGSRMTRDDNLLSRISLQATSLENKYSYDSTTGTLTIQSVGNSSGTIVIRTTDGESNLEDITIHFELSNAVKITNLLFYPNPYRMGNQDLILGYFVTQECDVTMYLFDHNGQEILRETQRTNTIGYDQFIFASTTNALAPGIYLCKVVAKDDNGNSATSVTKLSIF